MCRNVKEIDIVPLAAMNIKTNWMEIEQLVFSISLRGPKWVQWEIWGREILKIDSGDSMTFLEPLTSHLLGTEYKCDVNLICKTRLRESDSLE